MTTGLMTTICGDELNEIGISWKSRAEAVSRFRLWSTDKHRFSGSSFAAIGAIPAAPVSLGAATDPRLLRRVPQQRPMLQKRIDDQPSISRESIREAEAIFLQHLRRVGLKQTGQRSTILRTFLETREHLSTDELHRLVKKKDSGIGFTTVYRTLKLLAGCGLASEVAFHDGIARYEHQYNRRSHHHMVCTECGASVEFFSPEVGEIEREIGRRRHYLTTRHTFQIYGVCDDCQKGDNRKAHPRNGQSLREVPHKEEARKDDSRKKLNGRRIV